MSDNEFAELLWENGQVVLHGRKKHFPTTPFLPFTCSSSSSSRAQEKYSGDAVLPKMATFSSMPPSVHDFSIAKGPPAAGFDATQDDDDSVPWIHYPIIDDDDTLPADYCSDFLSQLPAATHLSSPPTNSAINKTQIPTSSNMEQWHASKTSHTGGGIDTSCRVRSSQFTEPSKQCHSSSIPTTRSENPPKPEFISTGGRGGGSLRTTTQDPPAPSKQLRPSTNGQCVINFSIFSRPAALAKANFQGAERLQSNDKASIATASNPIESTIVQTMSGLRSISMFPERISSLQPNELRFAPTTTPKETVSLRQPQAAVPEQEMIHNKVDSNLGGSRSIPPSAANAAMERDEARKAPEAAVATSSVCSGNGAGNDPRHKLKRKHQAECSASQDEDLEDESGLLRRSAACRSTKRSRTAEVHNLSERRRRDRINEKMRALQELIPNCNKIDKASMLDEAIEYLKTLQLQVQMMSMGGGLCIPPMLLPPAMQHLQIPPMAHFPHIGMGMGYGMGLFDMNSSPGCPMIPLAPMPGAQFPCPMIPGAQSLAMPGSNAMSMFGIPGQGIPSSASRTPPFASLASLPIRSNLSPQISGPMANPVQEQLPSFENQQQQSLNLETTQKANAGDSQIPIIPQGEKQLFKLPSLARTSSQFLHASGNGINFTGKNGAEPSKTASSG